MFGSDDDIESPWGPHEFCMFKCGPTCISDMEPHPKVTVITDYGTIIEGVQAHWDDGDRSVGIPAGYYIDDDTYGNEDMYIIWPLNAADYIQDDGYGPLAEKVKLFRDKIIANR